MLLASGYDRLETIAHMDVSESGQLNDIDGIIDTLAKYLQLEPDELTRVQDVMRSYYDGYLFPGSTQKLYNSTLVAYFLNSFLWNQALGIRS